MTEDEKTLDYYLAEAEQALADIREDAHPQAMLAGVKIAFKAFAKAIKLVASRGETS